MGNTVRRGGARPCQFGHRLRTARRAAGLSQRELAERAEVSIRAIRDIEMGRVRRPRQESVRRLARVLGLDPQGEPMIPRDRPEIGVLGPLRISRGDGLLVERSVKQRSLLGVLALQPGRVVGREELVDVLWGERPPATSRNLIHTYVARLRRLLEPDLIVGTNGGYRLSPDHAEVDLLRFDDLVDQAHRVRDQDPAAALQLLDRALRCWRGPVVADLTARLRQHPAAVAVRRRRLTAALAHADLAIELRTYDQAIGHLQSLAHEEPLHEGMHARLMLALAGYGQQAAALAVFTQMRDRLIEDLGVEPSAQLRDAQLRVLNSEIGPEGPAQRGPAPPIAQLPANVPRFTGRAEQLASLDELAERSPVIAIVGMAGVGKTALAVHWAHRAADRFADGQLYLDLRGYSTEPSLEPLRALATLLGGLGVAADKVPVDVDQAAALYRSLLTGKRMLLVLDNARSAQQIRPLLPGHAGCVVVITSRGRMSALVATHGAHPLALDVLAPAEATLLLSEMLGEERIAAERGAAVELAELCGRLPLALRIAAANLIGDPGQSLAGYAKALQSRDRLSDLAVEDDPLAAVRLAFDHSYRLLSPPARRLFRLFGLVPAPDLGVPAAAALGEIADADAKRLSTELAVAHLLEPRGPGRVGLHDLLRLYARERTEDEDPPGERAAAIERLLMWYVRGADEAARLLYPLKVRLPVPSPRGPAPRTLHDQREALAWLDTERAGLVAAVRYTAEHGQRHISWLLADILRGYFWLRRHTIDWLAVAHAGLAAATDADDLRAQASGQLSLGHAYGAAGQYRRAVDHAGHAVQLAHRARWTDGRAEALSELGLAHWWLGNLRWAADHLTQSLTLSRRTGREGGQAIALMNLGIVARNLGDLQDAATHLSEALSLYRKLGSRNGEDQALGNLGVTYHFLGRLEEARDCLTRALVLFDETGNRFGRAYVLVALAAVHLDAGRLDQAEEAGEAARDLAVQIGHRYTEVVAHNTLGGVRLRTGDHLEALVHHRHALDLARRAKTRTPQIEAHLGLAATYLLMDRPAEALDDAGDALALAEKGGMRILAGLAHAAAAAAHHALCHAERARGHADRALVLHRETGHRLGQARTLRLIGDLVLDRDGADQAAPYWRDAVDLFIAVGGPEAAELRALRSL